VLIVVIPFFIVTDYSFLDCLYRALVFLVISCPCALVISIPLGYFGGIGAASKNGVLVKGANYLDALCEIDSFVFDKTGTLTEGAFAVDCAVIEIEENLFWSYACSLAQNSSHPISKAISKYKKNKHQKVIKFKEISGKGISGDINGTRVLLGNKKLMDQFHINCPAKKETFSSTLTYLAVDNTFAGIVVVSDKVKEDSAQVISELYSRGFKCTMLSGDKNEVVTDVAHQLNLEDARGELMPDEKYDFVFELQAKDYKVAFVGDGVNDAPVIKLSNIGIAMGGLGSDAAIESADIVIQSDRPSKIITVLDIAKATKKVVWQNIYLAFIVKALVLLLGAWGMATLWQAVIADVGVALLAILNSMRIQRSFTLHSR
ncbi:MAG: heavy metal translocating P-type ATPase, partial [Lentisphaeraceae bacterium]|nr:heavy metal translocating P-type ATPase [Lentisphaeraceae bacterium]